MSDVILPAELDRYRRIRPLDTEYTPRRAQLPDPICYAVGELRSGASPRTRWVHGGDYGPCPYDPDEDLIVCFEASAELSFFRSCGWPLPRHILDLRIAFRIYSNGRIWHSSLFTALETFKIEHEVPGSTKERYQQLCANGGPFSDEEKNGILWYCATDIAPLGKLLTALASHVDLRQVIEFGRYSVHCALVEERGMPIDVDRVGIMARRWDEVLRATVQRANQRMSFRIYGGPDRAPIARSSAQVDKLFRYLGLADSWPRTETGLLKIDKDTLKDMESRHPVIGHLRQAERMLHMTHPRNIAIGPDGRCRTQLRALGAKTSRTLTRSDTPLSFASGMRAVFVPNAGTSMIVADYGQVDPAAGAALSGDRNMLNDYASPLVAPDFYMSFAARTGAVPEGAARSPEYEAIRNIYKRVTCAIMYGAGDLTLSWMLGVEYGQAQNFRRRFRIAYPRYTEWTRAKMQQASIDGFLSTPSGWVEHGVRGPTAQNFPIQAIVADVLRRASLSADAAGLPVIFSQHDSIGLEVESRHVLDAAHELRKVMGDASEAVLGVRVRVDVQVVVEGERWFKDSKAAEWWTDICHALGITP